jgi:hypothetical protein
LRTRLADQAGKTERNDESTDAGAQDEAPEILNYGHCFARKIGREQGSKGAGYAATAACGRIRMGLRKPWITKHE